jgi:hypothetical protein
MKNDEGNIQYNVRRSKRALLKSFSAYVISYTTRSRPGFSTRTLLFLVDPEKARSGATVRQRRIDAQIHRTKHIRRQRIHTTGADSSGSFLRRTCQTLNASKSVRNWTPNSKQRRGGQVPGSAASPSRRSYHGRVLFSARTLLFLVDPEKSYWGATVRQRRIDAQIHRTKHIRRQHARTTGAGI